MSISAANAAFSDTLVRALLDGGVEHAVVSPGSRNTSIVLALHRAEERGELATHVVIDERVAGFVALGIARATGKPVVLSCTSGSAGAHYLPAIAEAARSGLPLVAITADRPQELHERGAPQTMAQRHLFGDHVYETIALDAPYPDQDLRWLVGRVAAALHGMKRSGKALHINAAFREPLYGPQDTAALRGFANLPAANHQLAVLPGAAGLSDAQVAHLDELAACDRVMVVCGPDSDTSALSAASRRRRASALQELCAARGWALISDPVSSVGRFGDDVVHHADLIARDEALFHALAPEKVLVLGDWPTSKALGRAIASLPAGRITSVRPHGDLHDPWFCVARVLEASVEVVLDHVRSARSSSGTSATMERFGERWLEADRAVDSALSTLFSDDALDEWSIARTVAQSLHEGWLHLASSMPIRDFDAFAGPLEERVPTYANRGVNGIDGLVATAAGVSIASDDAVTLLIGDIALQHDLGGLAAASALRGVRLRIIAIDNDGGQIFQHLPIAKHPSAFYPYFVTHQPTDLIAAAISLGGVATRVETHSDLRRAMERPITPGVELCYIAVEGGTQRERRESVAAAALAEARQRLGVGAANQGVGHR